MTYIGSPLTTDTEALFEEFVADVQAQFPDWTGSQANLEVVVASWLLNRISELRSVASDVPDEILRTIGGLLHGTPATEAAAATADVTWTVDDTSGYTIPAGTEIAYALSGTDSIGFRVVEDTEIPEGDTSVDVPVECLEEGTAGNDLTGSLEIVNPVGTDLATATVTIVFAAASSGGTDAESNEDYLARLVSRLQLQAPRPILARDFAVLALDNASVGRATAIDNLIPGTNEVQVVTVDATGGTFTWTHGGQTTAAIDFDATAAEFQTAIEALSNFLPGDVEVTGGPGDAGGTTPYEIEFTGQYAETDVAAATTNAGSLTGGAGTAAVTTDTAGVAADDAAERAVTVFVTDEDWAALSSVIRGEVDDELQAYREANFLVYVRSPAEVPIQVTAEISVATGFDEATVITAVETALASYFPAGWAEGVGGDTTAREPWAVDDTVRFLEVAQAINSVTGVSHITSLEIGREGDTLADADITLPAATQAALPTAGTFTVTAA